MACGKQSAFSDSSIENDFSTAILPIDSAIEPHSGKPYCRTHYPYSAEYIEAKQLQYAQWEAEGQQRRDMLEQYVRLQEAATSLNSMNDLLRRALDHLDMETPKFESPSSTSRKSEALDIDGLVFRLEQAEYHHECPSWWVQGKELSRLALLQHRSVGEWAVFELDPMTGGLRSCTSDVQFDSREWVQLFFDFAFSGILKTSSGYEGASRVRKPLRLFFLTIFSLPRGLGRGEEATDGTVSGTR